MGDIDFDTCKVVEMREMLEKCNALEEGALASFVGLRQDSRLYVPLVTVCMPNT